MTAINRHYICRRIEIDAGHRIPDHASKCKNLHGHRYEIWATCEGKLFEEGEQKGMVLDFGFLKNEMVKEIDRWCDHGLILSWTDPYTKRLLSGDEYEMCESWMKRDQCAGINSKDWGKLYFIGAVPTAENLAYHWYGKLKPRVLERTYGKATLVNVRVFETPNCYSDYPGDF